MSKKILKRKRKEKLYTDGTETLFLNFKTLKQPRYSSVGEWINKLWYIQTIKY
jgi:hypothetical protein